MDCRRLPPGIEDRHPSSDARPATDPTSMATRRTLTITAWTSWEEWQEVYGWLFAIDDPLARARGIQRVATWRSRGRVPLAVEATASLAESALAATEAIGAPSEYAVRLMLAMVITRFVNGVVDPLQQYARAASVKRLAHEIQLPVSLVELRHECTHNRLPSLANVRLAAEQALLWLHEHYWMPQRNVLSQLPGMLHACLARFRDECLPRCTSKQGPPKALVRASVAELRELVQPAAWPTTLLPMLLDEGLMALRSCASPVTVFPDGDFASPVRQQLWLALLQQLQAAFPQQPLGSALLVACAERILAESRLAAPQQQLSRPLPAPACTTALAQRLYCLQWWALAVLDPPKGRDAQLRLDAHALQRAVCIAARDPGGWSCVLLKPALQHADAPALLKSRAQRLLRLHSGTEKLLLPPRAPAAAPLVDGGDGDEESSSAAAWLAAHGGEEMATAAASAPFVPLAPGSPWCRAMHWSPVAIGAPPPTSLDVARGLSAALAEPLADAIDSVRGAATPAEPGDEPLDGIDDAAAVAFKSVAADGTAVSNGTPAGPGEAESSWCEAMGDAAAAGDGLGAAAGGAEVGRSATHEAVARFEVRLLVRCHDETEDAASVASAAATADPRKEGRRGAKRRKL